MPFVSPPLLGSSIFLYGSEQNARDGANWGGSGFLVGIPSRANPSRVHLYAVTNAHVIEECPVARIVERSFDDAYGTGDPFVLVGDRSFWTPHPGGDDIAISPLGARVDSLFWYVQDDLLLSQADLNPEERPYQISPGDDCLMIGRYINQEHRQFDRPAVRFGNLAMLPEHVYQAERSFEQESFLVDMRSHGGFSGSPVFVYYEAEGWRYLPPLRDVPDPDPNPDPMEDAEARVKVAEERSRATEERAAGRHTSGVMGKTWLLGIDWGHLPIFTDVLDGQKRKIGRVEVNGGMAGVVPAWKLRELLDEKGIKMARERAEEELAEVDEGAAVLDLSEGNEFERFESLTAKLVQVPKRELDEQREES